MSKKENKAAGTEEEKGKTSKMDKFSSWLVVIILVFFTLLLFNPGRDVVHFECDTEECLISVTNSRIFPRDISISLLQEDQGGLMHQIFHQDNLRISSGETEEFRISVEGDGQSIFQLEIKSPNHRFFQVVDFKNTSPKDVDYEVICNKGTITITFPQNSYHNQLSFRVYLYGKDMPEWYGYGSNPHWIETRPDFVFLMNPGGNETYTFPLPEDSLVVMVEGKTGSVAKGYCIP